MNEPEHPHFVLSDGQYCHVLEDRLVIGKRDLPDVLPSPVDKLDYVILTLQIAALFILGFFTVMTILAGYYVVTFTLGLLEFLLLLSIIRTTGFTATPAIMKSDIVGVDYHRRGFGYDFFIVRYSGAKGKLCKRRLIIYDSHICLEQALRVLKEYGVLN